MSNSNILTRTQALNGNKLTSMPNLRQVSGKCSKRDTSSGLKPRLESTLESATSASTSTYPSKSLCQGRRFPRRGSSTSPRLSTKMQTNSSRSWCTQLRSPHLKTSSRSNYPEATTNLTTQRQPLSATTFQHPRSRQSQRKLHREGSLRRRPFWATAADQISQNNSKLRIEGKSWHMSNFEQAIAIIFTKYIRTLILKLII